MTLISVAVVSSPVNAHQSLTTRPAPSTSDPRLTVPACKSMNTIRSCIPYCFLWVTYHERYLQQATKLVLVLNAGLRVHDATLIRDHGVTAHQHVVGDGLPEDLHLQHIRDDFLRFPVNIWVDQGNIIVARDDVPECRQSLLYPLDRDCIGEGIAQVLKLLVCGGGGYEQAVTVPCGRPSSQMI